LYQYRVDFNPEEDRISTKRGLLAQHREILGGYLFDGTMLFSGNRFDPPVSCCYLSNIYYKKSWNYFGRDYTQINDRHLNVLKLAQ